MTKSIPLPAKSLLAVDPSVNSCGYSVWNYGSKSLIDYGLIEPGEKSDYYKVLHVAETIAGIAQDYKAKEILIENVPDTLYGQAKLTRDMLIAKAQSVFKTVSVIYTIVGLAQRLDTTIVFVLPTEWQNFLKLRKKGFNIKRRSVEHAQKVMNLYTVKKMDLSTPIKRENIADAINIGYYHFERKDCG